MTLINSDNIVLNNEMDPTFVSNKGNLRNWEYLIKYKYERSVYMYDFNFRNTNTHPFKLII